METIKSNIKGAVKSKTMYLAAAISLLQPVLENLPQLKGILAEWYGLAFFSLAVTIATLRFVTTKALSEK